MSLFKARDFWSTVVGEDEEFDVGCICVADIDNKGRDKIIVGSYNGYLRVYQPTILKAENGSSDQMRAEDVLCETNLSLPILQVEAGRFISGADGINLAVLQPRRLAAYSFTGQGGSTDQGSQYQLRGVYEHKLQRTAFNFCFGTFGGVKGKDFICIQSMDGTLSFFEQETFAFSRFLPGFLLPGPIKYARSIDSFVTASTSRQIECYKFQVLATATDKGKEESQSMKSGKRVMVDWTFLINETAIDIVVFNGSSSVLIFVLGERNLYALSESGQLNYMKKFEVSPSCFLPYYTGSADVNCIVGTHSKTLLVYHNVTLNWAAQIPYVPVQIRLANFQDLKGVIVTMDESGHLQCSYLGTDPSVFTRPSTELRDLDYSRTDDEMAQLQAIIKEKQTKSMLPAPSSSGAPTDLKLSVSVASTFDKISVAQDLEFTDDEAIPSITVTASLKSKSPVENVKVQVVVEPPLFATISSTNISSIEPGKPVDVTSSVFMKQKILPSSLRVEVVASYYNSTGAPRVLRSSAVLPVRLILKPMLPVKNATHKLTIDTNKSAVNLGELFSDLLGGNAESFSNAVGFKYYGLEPVVTLLAAKNSSRYRIQSEEFPYVWHVFNELFVRLSSHFKSGRNSDFRISYDSALPLQEYFEIIDGHFECRSNHIKLMKSLEDRAAQFRAVQKRLLVLYKDKTPVPLKNLDTLLDSSHKQIMNLADAAEENKQRQVEMSSELACMTRIVNLLLRLNQDMSQEDFAMLESCLSPPVVDDNAAAGWEETVEASITHLLRTNLSKNVKDQAVNPSPMSAMKDTEKVRKHIALLCDRLIKGARLSEGGAKDGKPVNKTRNQVTMEDSFADIDEYFGKNKPEKKRSQKKIGGVGDAPFANGNQSVARKGSLTTTPEEEEEDDSRNVKNFMKKRDHTRSTMSDVPDLDELENDNESDGTLRTGNDELIMGL